MRGRRQRHICFRILGGGPTSAKASQCCTALEVYRNPSESLEHCTLSRVRASATSTNHGADATEARSLATGGE